MTTIGDKWSDWTRNVVDEYKNLPSEEIKKILEAKAFPYAICFEHWQGDFNIGTGIRNANAFGAKEVFYLGKRKWDKRGAVGTYNYLNIKHLETIEDLKALNNKYTIYGVDNVPGSISLDNINNIICECKYPLFVMGEEGTGITPDVLAICKSVIKIDMYGSVRSLNCGTASGILMYELAKNYKVKNENCNTTYSK